MFRRQICERGTLTAALSVLCMASRCHGSGDGGRAGVGGGLVVAANAWSRPPRRYERTRAGEEAAAAADPQGSTRTFWAHPVQYTAPADLKRRHAYERAADKSSRFHVRSRLREDGVVSNLFPLSYETEGAEAVPLYIYEMYVTRKLQPSSATAATSPEERGGATPLDAGAAVKRVSPKQSWQAIRRSLQQRYADLPPMVQVDYRIYAAAPLPADALKIPAQFHDLGWKACELRLLGRYTYTDVPPSQLQELINKIVVWCAAHELQTGKKKRGSSSSSPQGESYTVVRERTGKLVCTSRGIAAGGLRIFKGVLVQALFIDDSCGAASAVGGDRHGPAAAIPAANLTAPPPPEPLDGTPGLAGLAEGAVADPLRFLVDSYVRTITYKGKRVESYYISDSSGKFLASYWEPPAQEAAQGTLRVGKVYVATQARVKDYPNRGNLRLFEFTEGTTTMTMSRGNAAATPQAGEPTKEGCGDGKGSPSSSSPSSASATALPGRLALKIDTKGTIASETSLWEDVKQHFGPGPYDEETQRRIALSVQGTPVVASFNLRQGIVRLVRFDANTAAAELARAGDKSSTRGGKDAGGRDSNRETGQRQRGRKKVLPNASDDSAAAAPVAAATTAPALMSNRLMDPGMVPLLPHLDGHQPWAVLTDYTALPLQVLHCCFDPTMKGWQDIAVAALSLMPEKRMELLQRFRQALAAGLRVWGLKLAQEPWRTTTVSLLPTPVKDVGKAAAAASGHPRGGRLRHPPPTPFPTTLLILGIAGSRSTSEEGSRISLTTQQMAAFFRTNLVACVPSEADAVRCMTEQLLTPASGGGGAGVLRDPNAGVIIVSPDRESRAVRWLSAECLCRGVLPLLMPPAANPKKINLLCANARRQLLGKYETNPLRGVDLGKNIPVLAHQRVLVVGVDSCHTSAVSTGAVVGILHTPERNHLLPVFWRHEARGRETQHVADHFRQVLAQAVALYDGLDQVVIFQDGDVFSELNAMQEEIKATVPNCGLTFMCLHKRTNIRFVHDGTNASSGTADKGFGGYHNLVKGNVIPALTPVPLDYDLAAPSFYLQAHESNMSTARTVAYTVHHVSPTLDVADVQQLANVMANVMAPQATKLPMSTRCAHKLAEKAERLLDAVPQLTCDAIPAPLSQRLWFL